MLNLIKNFTVFMVLVIIVASCKKNVALADTLPDNVMVETKPPFQKPYTTNINRYVGGYYEALPNHYAVTTKRYPLLIFFHGGGQVGDGGADLPLVLNDGVAKEINELKFPANFLVNGNNFSFIVLSPQFRATPPDSMVYSFVDYALKKYRIDSSRIYLSGLSMGGVLATNQAGQHTSLYAAVAPLAGESFGSDKDYNAANIAHGNLALWDFHNSDDPSIPTYVATDFINLVNSYKPGIVPKITIFQASGHDAWSEALDPAYKENNMNLYEWMLHYKR